MRSLREHAVRRFAVLWTMSTSVKLLALVGFLVVVTKLTGGGGL